MLVGEQLTISGTHRILFYPILLKDTVLTVSVLSTNGVIIVGYLTPDIGEKTPLRYGAYKYQLSLIDTCVNDIIGHYGLHK